MSQRILDDRRRALEEAFFRKREAELLEMKRAEHEREEQMVDLARACGIEDRSVLSALTEIGIEPETLPALALVPLVAIAWADGRICPTEKTAVLDAAHAAGIEKGSSPSRLLESWLQVRPPETLFDTWLAFAREFRLSLSEDQRSAIRTHFVGRAESVADVAGGILNLGPRISSEERAVLDEIGAAI